MQTTRDDTFIPLTPALPAASDRPDFMVTVKSQTESHQPFQSLEQTGVAPAAAIHTPACEPRVSVQQEGDRISAIRIQCVCGQVIELACVYDAAPEVRAPSATTVSSPPTAVPEPGSGAVSQG